MTVYVIQDPGYRRNQGGDWVPTFDLTPAMEHGELRICLPQDATDYGLGPAVPKLRHELRNYDPERDCILPVGNPAAGIIAGMVLAEFGVRKIRTLRWRRSSRSYAMFEASLNGGGNRNGD